MLRVKSVFVGLALAAAASAQTLIAPAVAAAADGNSSSGWPFDVAAGRLLYIYDSSNFTAQGVNYPILINQISWRANASTATWTGVSFPLQLDLSTSPIDYLVVDTTWNNNHGADRATVFNGTMTIAPGSSTTGVPGPFYATCTFTTPFYYDPTLGDLVIDTIHSGSVAANTPTMDAVTTAGAALARRVYSLTSPPAATATTWSGEIANVLEFTYTPAVGLYANFQANVTGGASPLSVNFTDMSYTSAPAGVVGWAWDFDGDTVIDSTLQNPTFVYTSCGNYDVTLTAVDGINPPSVFTRTAYIKTDRITASFTDQLVGPQTVQFTDTSNMAATSWAWDLDGDGIIDSTVQNPAWVYPSTAPVNVSLTVTRLCSPPSTITKQVVPAQVLTTNLAQNNGGSSLWTVFMDVNVMNPLGVEISAFDSISSTVSTAFTVDVYLKTGTYVGAEWAPSAWTLVNTASGVSNPVANQPSLATFANPLYLPQGSYGLALRYNGIGMRYVSGAGTYGNGDLSLTLGAVAVTTAAPFTGTTLNTPRAWSGTIYYGTHNITGSAGYGFFAPGCPGTLGVTHLTGSQPVLGNTLTVTADHLTYDVGLMISGLSNAAPLPLDLTFLGAPGCYLRVNLDLLDTMIGAGNVGTWSLPLPNVPSLSGIMIYNQVAAIDTVNAFGFVMSDAAGAVLGF